MASHFPVNRLSPLDRLRAALSGTHPNPPRPLAERDMPAALSDALGSQFLSTLRPAAVLVAVIDRPDEPSVLFTRRATHLRAHAGQVSFPGGRSEPEDAGPAQTALRESFEEVGLEPDRVELVGYLDDYPTVTRFLVTPVVGVVEPGASFRADRSEVEAVFEVPLAFLLDARNYERRTILRGQRRLPYWALEHEGNTIWGATAGMLHNLLEKVG